MTLPGVVAILSFAFSLILYLASLSKGIFVTWQCWALIGLLLLSIHLVFGWLPLNCGRGTRRVRQDGTTA